MIYPTRCPICGEIIGGEGQGICVQCKDTLEYIQEPRCKRCSKPVEMEEQEYCVDCNKRQYHFLGGYALWVYNDKMRKSISVFKYHHRRYYGALYVTELLNHYSEKLQDLNVDAIVPIPIHWSKHLERGYNQADILAKGIGEKLNLPVLSHLLIRNKKTVPQKRLSDKERLQNLREAFLYNKVVDDHFNIPLKRVLLVDDIYTTGSTIEACASVLIAHGIEEIYFITLCIGRGF